MHAEHPQIGRAVDKDVPRILDLVRLSLGAGTIPRTLDYWLWKHEANPFGVSPVLVAEDAGRLVGLRAFMRWGWRSGSRHVPAVRAVDTATHPDYRGMGLFTRLTLRLRDEMAAEGVAFVFNTPNAQSRPGYLKMGWETVGRPSLWVRVMRPVRFVRGLRREGLGGDEDEPPVVDSDCAADALASPLVHSIVEGAAPQAESYHTAATLEYLRWRYAAVPGFTYSIVARGEGAEGALIVMRSRRRGSIRELRLCDLVLGRTAVARRNMRRLLSEATRASNVDVILAMRPPGLPAHTLLRAGYVPAPRTGPILTAYPLSGPTDLPDPRKLGNWGPAIGDLELF